VFVLPAVIVLADRPTPRSASRGLRGLTALSGARYAAAALAVYLLFVISPIWPYEHKLPAVSTTPTASWGTRGELDRAGAHRAGGGAALASGADP
jgi:hypothetical protein